MPEPFATPKTAPEPVQRQRDALRAFRQADRIRREAEAAAHKQHEQATTATDAALTQARKAAETQRIQAVAAAEDHRKEHTMQVIDFLDTVQNTAQSIVDAIEEDVYTIRDDMHLFELQHLWPSVDMHEHVVVDSAKAENELSQRQQEVGRIFEQIMDALDLYDQAQERAAWRYRLIWIVIYGILLLALISIGWKYGNDEVRGLVVICGFVLAVFFPVWWKFVMGKREEQISKQLAQTDVEDGDAIDDSDISLYEQLKMSASSLWPTFVEIPAGEFMMGSPTNEGENNENPQHNIFVDKYSISLTEITNAQWEAFIQANGYSRREFWTDDGWDWCIGNSITSPECWEDNDLNSPNQPVVCVSWYEATAYSRWLSEVSKTDVRLPTEAEWEKAARGTDGRSYPWGNTNPNNHLVNFDRNVGHTTSVDNYPDGASPYGVVDMAGNVWEWTADWYKENYYSNAPQRNPTGPNTGQYRVLRGGSWSDNASLIRSAFRGRSEPTDRFDDVGFRLVALNLISKEG